MKAVTLIKNGDAAKAFEIREIAKPTPASDEVLIKVSAFGLNFADVMARNGMYKEAPPLPCVLGYDVAGMVEATGSSVTNVQPGQRVTALTRFGGYAEYAITKSTAVTAIPASVDDATATALTTQYITAYYAAAEAVNLFKGDKVLVHSGAGGVGTALIQYSKHKGCEIFSTAGSDEKLKQLALLGVQHCINYRTEDFENKIKTLTNGKGVDVIYDAVGGVSVKKGFRSLAAGGRLICYGASDMSDKNIFGKIGSALGFGFYHPVMLMMPSKAIIGVNMLKIADDKPQVIQRCLEAVIKLYEEGVFKPNIGKVFPVSEIAAAHEYLEKRKSMGKIVIKW
ncbi:MAG TPA: zinc-binding dehydrogenase [Ferruginibacter sp.]|nr:zinc-binding dehydrogenase [Ferruginibacter sp.]